MVRAKIVNVIEVRWEDEISYFTLEGISIGGFEAGKRVEPIIDKKEVKPTGGVIVSPKPEEVKREQEREMTKLMDGSERIKNIPR